MNRKGQWIKLTEDVTIEGLRVRAGDYVRLRGLMIAEVIAERSTPMYIRKRAEVCNLNDPITIFNLQEK